MRGKPWTVEEERQLRRLAEQDLNAYDIAMQMNKKPNSIYEKAHRLGLNVAISRKPKGKTTILPQVGSRGSDTNQASVADTQTTNSGVRGFRLSESGGLPSVEEALTVLVSAVNQLAVSGLTHDETLRLRSMINGVKTYKELFADFLNYKELERRMVELEAKYNDLLSKSKNVKL